MNFKLEFNDYNSDYLELQPKAFANPEDDYAKCALVDIFGMLFVDGDTSTKPIYYFRHASPNGYRFGGFVEFGDNYLAPQKGGYHHDDIAQASAVTSGYYKVSDNPVCFGMDSEDKYSELRFYADHATFKEGSFFECKATPFPYTLVDHRGICYPNSQVVQHCVFEGIYEGKKVIGMGNVERTYLRAQTNKDPGQDLGYIIGSGMGIRESGQREVFCVCIDHSGQERGYYWLEGCEPIISDKVEIITEWEHLPYVSDGTLIYKDAVFKFGGKEFHFIGEWGTKGFTKTPRIERHGQSQVFGRWYEGKVPYNHKLYTTFNENMEAYDYIFKERGYKIKD